MGIRQMAKRIGRGFKEYMSPEKNYISGRRSPIGEEMLNMIAAKLKIEADELSVRNEAYHYILELKAENVHVLSDISITANSDAGYKHLSGLVRMFPQQKINSKFAKWIESLRMPNVAVSPQFRVQIYLEQEGLQEYGSNFRIGHPNFICTAPPVRHKELHPLVHPLKITITAGTESREHIITSLPCTLGRSSTATIIVKESNYVSGNHVCFSPGPGDTIIIKDESRNGTFIDGRDMSRSTRELKPDSALTMELGFGRVGGDVTETIVRSNIQSGDRGQFPRVEVIYGDPTKNLATANATPDPVLKVNRNCTPDPILRPLA